MRISLESMNELIALVHGTDRAMRKLSRPRGYLRCGITLESVLITTCLGQKEEHQLILWNSTANWPSQCGPTAFRK